MNKFQRFSIFAIFFFVLSIIAIIYFNHSKEQRKKIIRNTSLNIFDTSLQKIQKALAHLKNAKDYKAKDDYISAIDEYYKAAKLHPEYMDATNKDFLGEELRETIKLSIVKLNQKLKEEPNNKDIISKLKIVYKMERNFGRGCE